jgi:hypothetical protein
MTAEVLAWTFVARLHHLRRRLSIDIAIYYKIAMIER